MLVRWVDGTNDSYDVPSIIFFHNFLQISYQRSFHFISFYFLFSYNTTKIKIKSFEYPKSIWNYEKKKYLKHQMLGRLAHWLYWRLLDFWSITDGPHCIYLYVPGSPNRIVKQKRHSNWVNDLWKFYIYQYLSGPFSQNYRLAQGLRNL